MFKWYQTLIKVSVFNKRLGRAILILKINEALMVSVKVLFETDICQTIFLELNKN